MTINLKSLFFEGKQEQLILEEEGFVCCCPRVFETIEFSQLLLFQSKKKWRE